MQTVCLHILHPERIHCAQVQGSLKVLTRFLSLIQLLLLVKVLITAIIIQAQYLHIMAVLDLLIRINLLDLLSHHSPILGKQLMVHRLVLALET